MKPSSLLVIAALVTAPIAHATQVKLFRTSTQEDFLSGVLDSISVDNLGALRLAQKAEKVTSVDEPFLFAACAYGDGWVVGTGNAGKVVHVAADGSSTVLFETTEPEVFAIWVDDDGTVYAGSSPNGKVYRWANEELTEFFDPEQTYIWQLGNDSQGYLLVATGTEGKLFRVDAEGSGEVLYDSDDTHLRAFLPLKDGSILAGTAGEGLLLRIEADGTARTLHDAAAPEIVALAPAPDGGAFVAVLASEASFLDLGKSSSTSDNSKSKNGDDDDDDDESKVEVDESSVATPAGSRVRGFGGPRSEILHWQADGNIEKLWSFKDETVFALLAVDDRLWVGTGIEGKLFSFRNDQMILEKEVDDSQIVSLLPGEDGPVFATTNAAGLFRFGTGNESSGSLTGSVLDAKHVARFGTLHWEGEAPTGTRVTFSFRSGMSSEPDRTWLDWSEPREGNDISLSDLESGRYLQWRLELASDNGTTPTVRAVELSYLQINQRPEIEDVTVLDPGKILVPSNFNANNQVYEPAHPNRDGIFTTIATERKRDNRSLKTLWKRGFRTVRWKATDPNEDELRYTVFFRREEDPGTWLPMAEDLEEQRYSFDSTVLPDGHYRLRVEASDEASNVAGEDRRASKTSDLIVVDHTPPSLGEVRRQSAIEVTVEDALSPLREAVYSFDAKQWQDATAADGLVDSRRETFLLGEAEGSRLLLLRVTDAAFNVITYDLTRYLE